MEASTQGYDNPDTFVNDSVFEQNPSCFNYGNHNTSDECSLTSPDNSVDSPKSSNLSFWDDPLASVKQEQTDESLFCTYGPSLNSVCFPPCVPQQPEQLSFIPKQEQQPQPSTPYVNQIFPPNAVNCPLHNTPVDTSKKMKIDGSSTRRYKYNRCTKVTGRIADSPPLPPEFELPAILGGKLPPRNIKTGSRKKHVFTEKELKSRRKRGLPDDSDSESEERRLVRLPRRSLLTITTPQMSHFVSYLRSNVKLTPSQLDELSRQKRLVKNRECACRFRAKKELSLIEYRERVNELENDLETLRAENERLRQALKEYSPSFIKQEQQQKQPDTL